MTLAYANRIQIQIDGSVIDSDITDYPLLLNITASGGKTNEDVTDIFTQLDNAAIDNETKLLLEFESDFSDTSASGHTVTSNGTPTLVSGVAPTGFNNSIALGSGDYLTVSTHSDFDFGTGDFTVDWWQNMTSQPSTGGLFQTSTSQYAGIAIISDSNVTVYMGSTGGSWDIANGQNFATSVPTGEWHHYAITRNGTTFRLFQDGVQTNTFESSGSIYPSTGAVQIGRYWNAYYIDSNVAEFRVSKGIARWTSNFIPPGSAYTSSYGNRTKIAVADTSDTQQYVEIEYWDHKNQTAQLWTKVPTITSGTNKTLYLYYDPNTTTNSGYVGDTLSTPAQNVWDINYSAVWHCSDQNPSRGFFDSTSNGYHGTPVNMDFADSVVGKIADGINFDGGEYFNIPTGAVVTGDADRTIEFIFNYESAGAGQEYAFYMGAGGTATAFGVLMEPDGDMRFMTSNDDEDYAYGSYMGDWHYIQYTYDGTTADGYIDLVSATTNTVTLNTASSNFNIGSAGGSLTLDGQLDEIRLSNIVRSPAHRKATYYNNLDDLVTFTFLDAVLFYFTNPIPTHLSKVYGTSHDVYLTVSVSGVDSSYTYDASFYNGSAVQIGSTVSGVSSGNPVTVVYNTPDGTDYSWYVTATSSGVSDTSQIYTFSNRFLCAGYVEENGVRASGFPVRVYRRSTGELIDSDITVSGGTFAIDSTYNEYHYAIAIHPDDGETNAQIYDWIIP